MEIKGVIFDMDGVILDSEKLYVRFWSEAGKACGYPFEREHALAIRSMARPYAIEKLKGFFGEGFDYDIVRNKRIEIMDAYVKEHGMELKPYAESTLKALKDKGYKIAIATATINDRAKAYLSATGVYDYFDRVVSAHEVKNGKPAPDIYLRASELLGLSPSQCVAVEDSPNGVLSAHRAGCRTIMIPDQDEPTEETAALAYAVLGSLDELRQMLV